MLCRGAHGCYYFKLNGGVSLKHHSFLPSSSRAQATFLRRHTPRYSGSPYADLNNARTWRDALWALDRLEECGLADERCYTIAITKCGKGKQWRRAVGLLEHMRDQEVPPNVFSYTAAMSACSKGKKKQWLVALTLLSQMKKEEIMPNAFSYTACISACETGLQWERALKLLDELVEKHVKMEEQEKSTASTSTAHMSSAHMSTTSPTGRTSLSPAAYNAAILCCAKAKQHEHALRVFRSMGNVDGVAPRPDVVSYGALLTSYAHAHDAHGALATLESMDLAGVEPNIICYNAAITAAGRSGDVERASYVFDLLARHDKYNNSGDKNISTNNTTNAADGSRSRNSHRQRVRPDVVSYNALLHAYEHTGAWQHAFGMLFTLMHENEGPHTSPCTGLILNNTTDGRRLNSVHPDRITFNTVISACASASQWRSALDVLSLMNHHFECGPDTVSYNSALHACAMGMQWAQALKLIEDMCQRGIARDALTYTSAMSACDSSAWAVALELFHTALCLGNEEEGKPEEEEEEEEEEESHHSTLVDQRSFSVLIRVLAQALAKEEKKRPSSSSSSSSSSNNLAHKRNTSNNKCSRIDNDNTRQIIRAKILQLWRHMLLRGHKPDIHDLTHVINACLINIQAKSHTQKDACRDDDDDDDDEAKKDLVVECTSTTDSNSCQGRGHKEAMYRDAAALKLVPTEKDASRDDDDDDEAKIDVVAEFTRTTDSNSCHGRGYKEAMTVYRDAAVLKLVPTGAWVRRYETSSSSSSWTEKQILAYELDLHGLPAHVGVIAVKCVLEDVRNRNSVRTYNEVNEDSLFSSREWMDEGKLVFITGQGHHSIGPDGAKMKPAIARMLYRDYNLRVREVKGNHGRLEVPISTCA